MVFGAASSMKKYMEEIRKQKIYEEIRQDPTLRAARATDDDFRNLSQALDQKGIAGEPLFRFVLATDTSEVGRSLLRQGLVRRDGKGELLVLTKTGEEVRNRLIARLRLSHSSTSLTVVEPKSQSLQVVIRDLRTAWMARPRITRFTIRSIMYRWRLWWAGTRPTLPMIEWSKIPVNGWTEDDRQAQREAWHRSGLLAFWLCPDGLDAGIEAHDRLLEICRKEGITGEIAREEVISRITGIKPIKKIHDPRQMKTSGNTQTYHVYNVSTTGNELLEVFQFDDLPKKELDEYESKLNKNIKKKIYTEPFQVQSSKKTPKEKYPAIKKLMESHYYDGWPEKNLLTPCGHSKGVTRPTHPDSRRVFCNECRASWVPASENSLKIASDEPNSFRPKDTTPCGHSKGASMAKSDPTRAICHQCGSSWIPASRNILEIASDETKSLILSSSYWKADRVKKDILGKIF